MIGNKVSAEECAYLIEPVTGIPVLNRTGFTGDFSIDIEFATINPFDGPSSTCDPPCGNNSNLVCAASPTISTALQSHLGLELALNRGSVDIWMIDGAENPSGK